MVLEKSNVKGKMSFSKKIPNTLSKLDLKNESSTWFYITIYNINLIFHFINLEYGNFG